jgi:hypothetical protein
MVGLSRLFAVMCREEFRMHAELFGGRRFAAFPSFVGLVAAGAVWLVTAQTATSVGAVVGGLHALVFVFGLHTGSVGLVGRDAMRNLIGDATLVLYSARTLPLSERRLLGAFLLSDLAYYAVLFLLPLSLSPAVAGVGPARLGLLWLSTTLTFALGLAVTLSAISLSARGAPGWTTLLALAASLGGAWVVGYDPVALTPYGLWVAPAAGTLAVALVAPLVLGVAGYLLIDLDAERSSRTTPAAFGRWHERLPTDRPLVVKTLLEVSRSSGGLAKIGVSAGLLFAVVVGLLAVAESLTGLAPSVGVSVGAMVGLSAFTTYNWVTTVDARSDYAADPLSVGALFRAKFRVFLLTGVPTALGYLLLAGLVLGGRPVELTVGAVLTCGLLVYLFGLTTLLAGLRPNEFLFDTVLFAAFSVAVAAVLVPVLVVGLTLAPLSPVLLGGTLAWGLLAGVVGLLAYRRAIPRWTTRFRTGV